MHDACSAPAMSKSGMKQLLQDIHAAHSLNALQQATLAVSKLGCTPGAVLFWRKALNKPWPPQMREHIRTSFQRWLEVRLLCLSGQVLGT